ncbi:proprotein convertase subtilisin/kexin type 4 isoform X6 [Bos indicus]|uniref:Proprotein convertase subtilisin/kexin type 4 isoform X6 n=1 Tax=Bos indicus TaxID=9915 RepID=A0ABM4SPB2_BOSIN|nr:proprotein convertase subtilisin/kexin type 4 isoform X8 [Bos taurus]XP_027402380.1 proprotein convertase subtilisin/kexin type 4 isoform X8 [Bos indicus x Bos taurus]XP_061279342.1 proprotein convertase subtilisin/kexin type 4 isoform X7 [Bos javanicus]
MRPARTALCLRLTLALGLALVGPMAVGWASARAPIYVSSWAVRVSQGYQEVDRLARKFGFVNFGQVGGTQIDGRRREDIFPDGQYFHLRHRGVVQQSLTPHWGHRLRLKKDPKVQWFQQQTVQRRVKRSLVVPTDPWFSKQWYMNNEMQSDLNILQVWSQGLSGQGVVVSVLDDGIEKDHPDLWANYDPLASYDFNDYDPDPQPRYTPSDENRHGTRCAGEVAAMANNRFCGAGVAYNTRIGGVRMLDGTITDVIEAQSLSLQPQHIHIYSASWGPEDDGRTVDGPGILTREAFRRGVTKGRGGLGTLFIWASGNGGLHYDNCNCDGYTNSIHTLSVGSTTQQGHVPWYSEACASTLTTTYSSGVATDPQIVTTDLHHQCTDKHTGTSASAPLAAGMIALALEANRPAGEALAPIPILPVMHVRKNVSACAGHANSIRSLEHVQVQLSLSYSRRGDLEISLTSPMGTRSTLVAIRPFDVSSQGYNNWIFMSTHFWDEDPRGLWILGLENKGYYFNTGTLYRYTLLLYGTAEDMTARPSGPQVTSNACVQRDTEGLCQECHSPAYILGHLCLAYCPPRYFNHTQQAVTAGPGHSAVPAMRVCSSCHSSCYTCRGSSPLDCTACPPQSMLDEQQGSCSGLHPAEGHSHSTATACPYPHGPAQAVVLSLLAMAFGTPPPLPCSPHGLPAAMDGTP